MPDIRETKLELLRNGPEHNQLLSPLTPYIALCGAWAPQTVAMPFEHRELVTRLARLRYGDGRHEVSAEQRETELSSIGTAVGRVLGQVPGLAASLNDGGRDGAHLVHLRLSLSALELGMVPFEAAIAPDNLPGSGAPLLLRTPTVMTREIRRNQSVKVDWDRPHRILYAFATAPGFATVPAQAHLDALRRAIEPYVPIVPDPAARVQKVQEQLTILPEATLTDIRKACAIDDYTHVHLLAHGAPIGDGISRRYGIVLRDERDPAGFKVVDGETLAIAMRGVSANAASLRPLPTFLSLATCDSGALDSVVVPGGSIAHELHRVGIPWVIASQFPLWMPASTILVETLYRDLLSGADPRVVLHQLRQRLRIEMPQTHDWASIVAYAVSPWDLEASVDRFFDRQMRRRLEVRFARLDELAARRIAAVGGAIPAGASEAEDAEFETLSAQVRAEHGAWLDRPALKRDRLLLSEVHGMRAASEKRIAIACEQKAEGARRRGEEAAATKATEAAEAAYRAALGAYREAVQANPNNHWAITQVVSIAMTPLLAGAPAQRRKVAARYAPWWSAARQIALWQSAKAEGLDRAWALGTLAELDLLGSAYESPHDAAAACRRIEEQCLEILRLMGPDSFAVKSTRRQFMRYLRSWSQEHWSQQAQAALKGLDGGD